MPGRPLALHAGALKPLLPAEPAVAQFVQRSTAGVKFPAKLLVTVLSFKRCLRVSMPTRVHEKCSSKSGVLSGRHRSTPKKQKPVNPISIVLSPHALCFPQLSVEASVALSSVHALPSLGGHPESLRKKGQAVTVVHFFVLAPASLGRCLAQCMSRGGHWSASVPGPCACGAVGGLLPSIQSCVCSKD